MREKDCNFAFPNNKNGAFTLQSRLGVRLFGIFDVAWKTRHYAPVLLGIKWSNLLPATNSNKTLSQFLKPFSKYSSNIQGCSTEPSRPSNFFSFSRNEFEIDKHTLKIFPKLLCHWYLYFIPSLAEIGWCLNIRWVNCRQILYFISWKKMGAYYYIYHNIGSKSYQEIDIQFYFYHLLLVKNIQPSNYIYNGVCWQ